MLKNMKDAQNTQQRTFLLHVNAALEPFMQVHDEFARTGTVSDDGFKVLTNCVDSLRDCLKMARAIPNLHRYMVDLAALIMQIDNFIYVVWNTTEH